MGVAYGRFVPVLSTALVVAALLVGIGSLRTLFSDSGGQQGRPSTPPVADVTDLDVGTVADNRLAGCMLPDFAADASRVEVVYGVRQRRLGGSSPVLVARNPAGDLLLCDQFGADRPAEAPAAGTASQPVAYLSTGRSAWSCGGFDDVLRSFQMSTWLAVSSDVHAVQQRYWVDGVPGPWFSTRARNGYAHLQTWLVGPEPAGSRFAEQYRVLDASGRGLRQTALPTRQKPLVGCAGNGPAEIG